MTSKEDLISRDLPFNDAERETLKKVVGRIIPPSQDHGIPGADVTEIFMQILEKARQYEAILTTGIAKLDQQSIERFETPFASADFTDQDILLKGLKSSREGFGSILTSITVQAYYQNARVLESLNLEPRPPFPKGHELEQGDWTLLDPVRNKDKIYRKI